MRIRFAMLFFLPLLMLTQCDFPSDPPLKTGGDPTVIPPVTPQLPDELVPLDKDNAWIFQITPWSRPELPPKWVSPRALPYDGTTFYYLLYGGRAGGGLGNLQAFPSLLLNDSTGLHFFFPRHPNDTLSLSRDPIYAYTLPYPAAPTGFVSHPLTAYDVRLTHLDTLMTVKNSNVSLPCRRYEVWRSARLRTVFYIVPGLCFLRVVDDDDGVFETLGWRISE